MGERGAKSIKEMLERLGVTVVDWSVQVNHSKLDGVGPVNNRPSTD